ncbi:D-aminoacyl-tRNA deacylase [Desulfogranum mediterraneum]|uniref:D-aminoacyl-tRNA deacylase n=1 Tax=Desulfogranum mediterraneum TaxID=160661 RepID=UPI00040EE580|nr:D-aminoacyl-tRNA deacylase [Desulfogranum mediterraneum]
MRALIQRVSQARVDVGPKTIGAIDQGLLVLLGVHADDNERDLRWLTEKIVHLRIFDDDQGVMNHSLLDIQGELLIVSQFTLFGDCRKGRRPSWSGAAPPDTARHWYQGFIAACKGLGVPTQSGEFQAMMAVTLTNDGPITLLLDSHKPS